MTRNPFLSLILVVFLACTAAFTGLVAVDPFGVWPTRLSWQLFGPKAERIDTVRLSKAYDLMRSCPDDVITGMSTVVWGIDPDQYSRANAVLYNGGIVGSSMEEQYYYIVHFIDQCPGIRKVYVDINGEALQERAPQRDFVPERLVSSTVYPPDIIFTTFSKSSIFAAYRTLHDAWTGRVKEMLTDNGNGFHYRPNLGQDSDHYNAIIGFLTTDDSRRPVRVSELQLAYLRQLVFELKHRNIELVLFFGPISQVLFAQAEARETLPVRPGENMYFELRRRVAEISDFWDFGLNNFITGEDIAHTKYFFDQIHYLPKLGTAVLAALNGVQDPSWPPNFVKHVTRVNIDEHIAALKAGNVEWRHEYPQYYSLIRDHYASVVVNEIPPTSLF
jgi:hypothetical protein